MKMKKVVAGLLSAAMVFTSVSYNGYGVNQAEAAATTAGTEVDVLVDYTQVNNDLKTNARANSQQSGTTGDGDASCAFDGNRSNWWHSNYGQNNAYQLAAYNTTTDAKIKDANQASKKIWIETMFNSPQTVYGLKYTSRGGTENNQIREYEVWVSTEDKHSVDINTEATTANGWTLAQSGTFYQTGANNEQTVRFDTPAQNVKSIRLVAKSVYTVQTGTNANGYVAANELKFCTQLNKVNKNLNNYGEFWDAETGAGTLSVQKAEDRWQFEVKVGGQWKNYLTSGDKRTNGVFFESGWRTNSNDSISRDGFRQKIGDNFAANAFAWVAPEAGYYKFKQHGNMGSSLRISGNMDLQLVKANATSADGTDLNGNENHNNGRAFESKIQKMSKGDRFRFVSTKGNGVNNYCDGDQKTWEVIPCTAKEYAAQWGPTVTVDETKPQALQSDVTESKNALSDLVAKNETEAEIKQAITDLETAIDRMNNYTTNVTGVTVENGTTYNLKVNDQLVLKAKGNVTEYADVTYTVTGNVVEQDAVNKDTFTAKTPGTATIKVASLYEPTVAVDVTVKVTVDKELLTQAIAKAEAYKTGNYTANSLEVLNTAIAGAVEVRDNDLATEQMVNDAIKTLDEAVKGLIKTYTVTVNGGTIVTGTATVEEGGVVTVKANAPETGKKFAYWSMDNKPVCYAETYTLTVYNDVALTAVYVQAADTVAPTASMFCTATYNAATHLIKFTAKRSLPVGATNVEHGIILTNKATWDAKFKNNQEAFALDPNGNKASGTILKTGTTTGLLGNYSVSVRCTKPNTWYAKGYVKYTYNNEKFVVYSGVTSYEVK